MSTPKSREQQQWLNRVSGKIASTVYLSSARQELDRRGLVVICATCNRNPARGLRSHHANPAPCSQCRRTRKWAKQHFKDAPCEPKNLLDRIGIKCPACHIAPARWQSNAVTNLKPLRCAECRRIAIRQSQRVTNSRPKTAEQKRVLLEAARRRYELQNEKNRAQRRTNYERKRKEELSQGVFELLQTEDQRKYREQFSRKMQNALLALRKTLLNQTKEEKKCQQH